MSQQQQQVQQMQQQQHFVQQQQQQTTQSVQQSFMQQQTQQRQQQTRVVREVRQGMQTVPGSVQMMPVGLPAGASPPVFEQIFRNARFAQGGDALFEGKVQGNPKPTVSWTRKGQQIHHGPKYQVTHDQNTGVVTLQICAIGPGDEGEYVCTASNEYGEAICTVYIQPEAAYMMQQQRQQQQQQFQSKQTSQTFMQQQNLQKTQQQQQQMQMRQFGQVESFRVDTFEYRLLHEVEFRQTLTQRVAGESDIGQTGPIQGPPQAPQISQKPRSTKVAEQNNATFTVKLAANPTPRVIWFKNGERLLHNQKYLMSQSAGQVTLVVKDVNANDSGYYTMLAENPSGCTVASAQLAVVAKGSDVNGAVEPEIIRSEKIEAFQQQMMEESSDESGKSLEPKFVRIPPHQTVQEGKMVRFDCRATGRPYPDVTWFLNGQMISNDANHKILVNEQGNHSLMITQASLHDAGVITCVARNKTGETSFQVQLNVLEREQVVAPKFVERFQQGQVREGETVQLHARAVGTPAPALAWQKDGVTIVPTQNIQVQSDGGASILQILSASAADAGWYQCTAQNVAGSTSTRARLHVQVDKSAAASVPFRPSFPKPTKVIEPEKEPEPEVIFLRHVERAHQQVRGPEEEPPTEAPQFTHFLRDIDVAESKRAHFEARVIPLGDATMQVEWLVDGKPLAASSRATVTYRFGYVALDILNVIQEDAGVYTCRATNVMGQAETSANLRVTEKPTIESGSQHPDALQKISYLEDQGKYMRTESVDEQSNVQPSFVKPLVDLGDVFEGKYAHFEAQLHPVSDPFMKIEWYKDGKPITASSRINVIYNFGYVALTIMHLRQEDSGLYTVRAYNKVGECTCQAALRVISMSSVTGDLGIPEQAQYIKSVEEMEAYRLQMQQRSEQELLESTIAPVFKSPLKDATCKEGGYAHFEARLEPIGDPTLKVEWLKDGRSIEASSRITTFFNFGYVALTIKALITRDAGTYTCRAYNAKGEAVNECKLVVISKKDIESESQYEDTVMKMQYIEDAARRQRTETEESSIKIAPRFLGPLKGTTKIVEGQTAHFEIRLEPQNDSGMRIEWYFNGKVIMDASRIKFYNDFGYVALDISDIRSEDSGTYTVVARNSMGEAQMSATMQVETRSAIDYSTMHEVTMSKTSAMERSHQEPQYDIDEYVKSKPVFTHTLQDLRPMPEGKNVHLEARLEPMGDPTMKVEWYFNGKPVTVGSRFRTYFDFGYVALDIIGAYSTDSGEYTCRAENALGSAHTSSCIHIVSTDDIETETMHDSALEQIHYLEGHRGQRTMQEDTDVNQPPTFTKSLKNIETIEGTNIHLEARLQPIGDSSMRVDWFFNDQPLKVGHRFRPAYDFDYVALDLLSVYPVDSGIYTCRATNKLGQAVTSASVRVIAKKDLVYDSDHPDALQKLQYIEDSSRYQRRDQMDEVAVKIKPKFLTVLKDQTLKEDTTAHFEAKLEPVTDSNLRVEWYKDGRPIAVGSRFRTIHDFGYVALDIRNLVAEDSGVYTCVATNLLGKDEISTNLRVISSTNIIMESQNEAMTVEQLQMLEERRRYDRREVIEETTKQAPVFTTSLKNIEILEGQRAHFEARLIPTSDPTMKVEWFCNNKKVKSGSRFTEYNDFGFIALDIMYAYAEDCGTYTCVATNALGQAMTSGTLVVHTKESIVLDTMNQEAMQKISRLENRSQRMSMIEEATFQAPVFTSPIKDQSLTENVPLHFEARLIPVGDPDLKVEWFKNGVPVQPANRISTMHDFGYVALDMKYVKPEDSGTYTCRATNKLGQAVCSASLVVTSKESLLMETQHAEALEKLRYLEDSSKYSRSATEETVVTQAPKFVVKLSGLTQLWEGQSAHVEGRLEPYPDPTMKVEWFHNGNPLSVGHRFRTMYDFGFCALDILSALATDSGVYEVRATNRLGTTSSTIEITVKPKSDFIVDSQHPDAMAKIQRLEQKGYHRTEEETRIIEKPNFGRALRNQDRLVEGQAVHMEATLTPVNDPTMKVEWFFNGTPIPSGHRFRTTYDFGFVALDILYAYPEDSGTYMCRATNAAGQAVTSCNIRVEATDSMMMSTLDEERMRKIRRLEQTTDVRREEEEKTFGKPVFTTALQSQDQVAEGNRVHLECRLEPVNDPNLKVEWFVNGVEIKTGHRFRTTHDFGYVALDILYSYEEDSGTYLCKATNLKGEAVNSCSVTISARRSIYMDTQHPTGWEKIQNLEQKSRYERLEVHDLPSQPPRFTSELRGVTSLGEGQKAHIEGRIEPIHDPSMRIEWYHNGKVIPSAARFHTTFDFGYVAFDLSSVYPEDSGEYVCRAFNSIGEATSKINLKIEGTGNIIYESARPEGLEKIKELEDSARVEAQVSEDLRTFQRPVFTQPLQNLDNLTEGETAHFECRLIPVGDPKLKVEWFRNEKPIEPSSRINRTHDFGYVALDIIGVRPDDEGIYMCRAYNDLGEAVTTASIKIRSHASIQMESQHPEGMRKIQALEERKPVDRSEPEREFEKPVFTSQLQGPSQVIEGQSAHYECKVIPVGDPNMKFEWYCNGVSLKMGSRFHTTTEFGYVTLDISQTIPEDSGVYMCRAYNLAGEAVSSCSTRVIERDSIIGDSAHPEGWEAIRLREAQWNRVPPTPTSPEAAEPPMFTKHLESYDRLQEGGSITLEGQVQPSGDPYLSIEWFKNGMQLATGTRIRSTFDFGHVLLHISGLREDDSGIYTCKAVNRVGEAVSTCNLKVHDRDWLIGDSVRPEALPKLAQLEQPRGAPTEESEPVYDLPVFISHLNNVECWEGDTAHFECNVEPSKDPTMKIEWFINGKPMQAAARYAANYDFGFVSLDCTHCYEEDSGIYMCKATNSKGSASTTGTLKCISKANIYLDTQHPQGKAGLEKVEEAERAFFNKSQRPPTEEEASFPKPYFIRPLEANFTLMENQSLHMEANVEPKKDPNLKIEWFLNGKPLEQGSRYKSSYDFGLVTLDLDDCYERDQGIYTCRAYNKVGEAFCTTTVVVGAKGSLIEGTQHPAGDAGLEAIQRMEESLRRSDRMLPDEEGHPPVFTTQFKSLSNIEETEIAHFEAMLTPVGDETMKVEWFYNGETLKASHRFRTVYAFGMVVLEVLGTKVADSGEYTCRATNKWGMAECSCTLEVVDRAHGQPPHFTTHIQDIEDAKDGQSGHFECTLVPVGDPNMKVEWFHNGQPLRNATRIKTVCDFGYVVMDIAYLRNHDTGEWVCKASNKYGEDYTKAHIKCTGKGGVIYDSIQPGALGRIAELEAQKGGDSSIMSPTGEGEPPKFITQIANIEQLAEGQSAHFEARLKPVGDPNLVVEWYKDGQKLSSKHRYRTFHDFGIVILDILYCYEEDSGVYEARAHNKYGEDKTSATMKCSSKAGLILSPQIPRGMEGGLDKIQKMEDTAWMRRQTDMSEKVGMPPKFTVPLNDIYGLKEGENAHFEAKIVPTDDPRLKIEWYYNGKPMKHSSRVRYFCDFGFVIMEISTVYAEDSGEYMCRAYNDYGEAVTKGILKCEGRRSIIFDSQLPKSMQGGMEKIAELEGLMIKSPDDLRSPDSGQPPQFITEPSDITITENQLAHFECKLVPVGDPTMRVEWYHNGRPLTIGTRTKTINDFGYVILEIAHCYGRDGGTYTCRAINRHGEATTECKLAITSKSGIVLDPQATGRFKGCTESIMKLEEQRFKKGDDAFAEDEKPNPPQFITNLENIVDLAEGQPAHFDCRVEPVGDPTMRIEWFHNGSQLGVGSRVHMMDDFGFVVLDLEWTFARDSGEYVCRATNKWGQATTSAVLKIKTKHGIDMNTQLPQGMTAEKLKELERGPLTDKPEADDQMVPPKFVVPIKDTAIEEGETARFEADVEPKNDPYLKIEWYFNGKPLQIGHRFRTSFEMGHVILELLYTYPEDSGEYICRAVNRVGQDATKASLKSKAAQCVIMQSQALKGVKPKDMMTQLEETMKKYNVKEILLTEEDIYDVKKRQPPRFVTQIQENTKLVEMHEYKFDCQLTPVGDPNMKVEWFFNGRPLPYKTRFTPIYDFGYVALIMSWLYGEDSGEYLCRATNKYGMDETRAFIKVAGRPGVIYESQVPKGMQSLEKIKDLESSWNIMPSTEVEEEKVRSKPEVLKAPETILVQEGSWARFSMRVAGYPKPRVMWIINGSTAISGNRFKIWYDGMFHLDIPKTRQYDEGKIEVIARNSLGEAYATCELKVKPRQDDYRAVLKNSPKQHAEESSQQYRKPEWVKRMEKLKHKMEEEKFAPDFIQEILNGRVKEMENHTFMATFIGNPKPEITWLHNERIVHQSQTYQMRVRGDKAILSVVQVSPEQKGEYVCKAANSMGEAACKANLEVIELTYDEKLKVDNERYAALQIQHAAEHMKMKEVERREKINQEQKEALTRLKEERKQRTIEKQRILEDVKSIDFTKQMKEKFTKVEKVEEKPVPKPKKIEPKLKKVEKPKEVKEEVVMKPQELRVSQIYTGWKKPVQLEETYPELEPEEFAPNQVPGVKCFVKVSETSMKGEEVVREIAPQFFEDEQVISEIAKVHSLLKNHVKVNEIWSMFRAGEFKHLQQPKIQTALVKICEYIGHQRNVSMVLAEETEEQAKTHPVGLKALLRMVKHAKDIKPDYFFKEVIPKEMGKFSSTTQELQKVSQMINQGIENEEIIATCEAGKLPTLKKPETQQPLINIVEKQGHTVMVAQVLVEEAYKDAREERAMAERAWQIVHEEELVQAEVTRVSTEQMTQETRTLIIQSGESSKETVITDSVQTFKTELPEGSKAQPREERGYKPQQASVTQVHSAFTAEMAPGAKAYVKVAKEEHVEEKLQETNVKESVKKEMVKVANLVRHGIVEEEVLHMMETGEFPNLIKEENQANILNVVEDFGYKAVTDEVIVQQATQRRESKVGVQAFIKMAQHENYNIETLMTETLPKELGPQNVKPIEEIAQVNLMLREGVEAHDIMSMTDAGLLPELSKPEIQAPLVRAIREEGHTPLVCQVLIEESVKEISRDLPKADKASISSEKTIFQKATESHVTIKEEKPKKKKIHEIRKEKKGVLESVESTVVSGNIEFEHAAHISRSEDVPIETITETTVEHARREQAQKILDTKETVSISQIQTIDQTDTIEGKATPLTIKADKIQGTQASLNVDLVDVRESISTVEEEKPEQYNIRPLVSESEHVTITEIKADESIPTEIPVAKLEEKKAKPIIKTSKKVNVKEVTSQSKAEEKMIERKPQKPSKSFTQSKESEEYIDQPTEELSDISMVTTMEEANISIPEDQKSLLVSQTVTEETTENFTVKHFPESAEFSIPKTDSLQITEISSEMIPSEFDDITIEKDKAEVTVIERELQRADQDDVLVLRAPDKDKKVIEILEEEKPEEHTEKVTIKKKPKKEKQESIKSVEETIEVKTSKATTEYVTEEIPDEKPEIPEPIVEETKTEVTIKKKIKKPKPQEQHPEEVSVELRQPDKIEESYEVPTKATIEETPSEPEDKEDTVTEVSLKRKPKKKLTVEETEEKVTLPVKKPEKKEEPEEKVTLPVKKPEKKEEPEIAETVTIEKKPSEITEVEETMTEVSIKKKVKPKKHFEEHVEEVSIDLKKSEETVQVPEKAVIEEVQSENKEETVTEVSIKKKPKKKIPPEEHVKEVSFEVRKPQKPEEVTQVPMTAEIEKAPSEPKEVEETTAEVSIKRKPKKKPVVETEEEVSFELKKSEKVKEITEVSEVATIERAPSEPKEVEETTTEVSIKRKPKKKPVVEETQEDFTIPLKKVVKEELPEETLVSEFVATEKAPSEPREIEETTSQVSIKRKPKKKPVVEETQEDVTVSLKKQIVEETKEDVTVSLKKPEKEEQPEEIISESVTIEKAPEQVKEIEETTTDISIKRKPKKKKPVEELTEEVSLNITQEQKTEVTDIAEVSNIADVKIEKAPSEPKEIEETTSEVTLKRKPKKKPEIKETDDDVTVSIQKPKKQQEVTESVVLEKAPSEPKEVEETTTEVSIKRKPKPKKPVEEHVEDVSFSLKRKEEKEVITQETDISETATIERAPSEPKEEEEILTSFSIRRKSKPKPILKDEGEEEVAIKLTKPKKRKESSEISESVVLKQKPVKEEEPQEVEENIDIKLPEKMEYTSEETTQDVKIKMKRPKKEYQIGEEEVVESKVMLQAPEMEPDVIVLEEDQEIIERYEITKTESQDEVLSQTVKFRKPKKKSYKVEDEEMEVGLKLKKKKSIQEFVDNEFEESVSIRQKSPSEHEDTLTENSPVDVEGDFTFDILKKQNIERQIQEIGSTETFRIPSPPSRSPVITQEGLQVQEAQLQIVEEHIEIAPPLDVKPGDLLRAVTTYVVEDEHENAMHLIEGERVYVQECSSTDWWYVEKHLTKERGFVPAKLLAEENSYNLFVQKRLEEKIHKLPVFDKLKPGEKPTAPKFTSKIEPKVVIDGQETQFICKIVGNPKPTITWFRQTAIIKPSEEFQTFYSDDGTATLIIKEVFPEDAGMFTCVAKNQTGAAACSAELLVEGPMSDHGSDSINASRRSLSRESSVCDLMEGIPPTFAQKAMTKTTEEGVTLELDVRLVAIPEPEITWRKDGQAIRDSNRVRIVKQKDVHAYRSIVVIKGTKKDDEGVYEITAKNREGEAKITIQLEVMAPESPEFTERLSDQTVEEEGTIRLVARVRGNPVPDVTWSSTFKKGLESCEVKQRSEVVLECRTTKETRCQWYKDGHKVKEEEERIVIEQEGLTHRLTITSAQVTDAGKYECIFDDVSTWCNLTIKGLEEFVSRLEDLEVTEREKATFQVEVSNEELEVTWHKDGQEITSRDTRFEIIKNKRIRKLVLKSAQLTDEGEYTCCMGDLECSAELGVRELPAEIVRKMQDQLVYRGNKAKFEVELTKGDAVITWFKNEEEIKFSDHYQLSIDGKVQRLMVYNCQMDDGGFYRAVVGKSECSAVLTVELQEEGDFLKKLQSEVDVTSGSDVTFTVQITKPEYDVHWFRNGEEIRVSERFLIEKDGNKRILTIKNSKKEDAGDYTCTLGKLKSACKLNVIVLETPPTIDKSQVQVEYVVKKGMDVTFTVPFKASPIPTAKWTHRGKTLDTNKSKKYLSTITENSASITIKTVENVDCGEYRLGLTNNCGNVSLDITLKILDKPSKPGWPEILQVTNNSVSIHWREPDDDGGRTITNYVVEYRSKTSQWTVFNASFTISETTTVVTELQTNEEYCFRVSAVNEMGTSEPSEESQFVKVCEPIRPEPPTVLEQLQPVVTGLYQTIVLRCVISGTPVPTIEWTKDGTVITTSTSYENFTATLTIKETTGNSAGMYTCRATNEAGINECTASVVIQETPKFEYDESLQAQMLYVGDKWHIPIKVTGYPQPRIQWTRNDEPIQTSARVVIRTEEEEGHTDIAIQKLEVQDSAVFTLTAENSGGKATLSFNLRVVEEEKIEEEEIIIEEKEEVKLERPGPPVGPLNITEITSSSVRLSWKMSTYDGGSQITSYYIERLEKSQKQWQKVNEVEANITTYVVENLSEGCEYFFRVFALNAIGLSEALESESVFIKSPFDVPGPPLGPFDVNIIADSSMVLSWDEPLSDGGSPITGYLVERREAFKKAWQKVGQTASEVTKIEITGLKRGSSYYFRVFAINEIGQGPPLQPEEPITAGKKITVPSMPTGLNVIDVTSKTVTLGWAPPTTTGGADLIGYIIQSRLTTDDKWQNVTTVDPSITLFCIENLTEKSEYEFRVYAENPVGKSEQAATTEYVQLKTHATPPSPPTAPLEARPTGPTSLMIEWGAPESDGGAPLLGYIIAIRDIKRTMWIEVGQVDANFTRLHIKELQENHEYNVRVFARNEVGTSDPLETEDPVQIIRPDDFTELPEEDAAPSLSYSTTETLSWMREAGVDADIYSYARGRLLNRDEYFFKVWHQTKKPFKEE